jgi:Uma2 family endonuclease
MTIELRRRTWTVGEYYRMVDAGLLSEDDHIELIEGEIVEMAAMGDRHVMCCNWLNNLLAPQVAGRAVVQAALPVPLSERSEPEPDFALLRWRERYRAKAAPADVLLFIEVADTSLRYDQLVKSPLYARAAIPEYWIVDLTADVVEVHDLPGPEGYGRVRSFAPGSGIPVPGVEGVTVEVGELFG